ncbi:MAG: sigma-70 family RNA polymerase sigma factor [Planctomycetota bacterium]
MSQRIARPSGGESNGSGGFDFRRVVEGAIQGDSAARDVLVREFYPRVRELVHRELQRGFRQRHRWILPLFSTGDVVQEVFQRVLDELDRFEGDDEDTFVRYLSSMVTHRLLDAVRFHEAQRRDGRRQRQVGTTSFEEAAAAPDPSPAAGAASSEHLKIFREVVSAFPARRALLLEMRLVHGESYAQIAARLGFPTADAARKAFQLARARMAIELRRRGLRPMDDTQAP